MSASVSNSNNVLMKSSDDGIFEVKEAAAVKSETIKNINDDMGTDDIIPVAEVDGSTLSMVIEWCNKHSTNSKISEELKKWDAEFFMKEDDELYHLLMAAKYLCVGELEEQLIQRLVGMIKGKKVEAILCPVSVFFHSFRDLSHNDLTRTVP
ncbi:SKP1-like protein 10 [Ziziphus jujuba]|uniref:SKP1-like protein n=1 Tax=Ziziphus jujuba TaxID=326968 RepID=A0ABM3IEL0_ZIZJJ|nr:SKP1-like protein 10 [Ziziphus jujuba]